VWHIEYSWRVCFPTSFVLFPDLFCHPLSRPPFSCLSMWGCVGMQVCAAHRADGGRVVVVMSQREKLDMESLYRWAPAPCSVLHRQWLKRGNWVSLAVRLH